MIRSKAGVRQLILERVKIIIVSSFIINIFIKTIIAMATAAKKQKAGKTHFLISFIASPPYKNGYPPAWNVNLTRSVIFFFPASICSRYWREQPHCLAKRLTDRFLSTSHFLKRVCACLVIK